jgi:hypothetical protein
MRQMTWCCIRTLFIYSGEAQYMQAYYYVQVCTRAGGTPNDLVLHTNAVHI